MWEYTISLKDFADGWVEAIKTTDITYAVFLFAEAHQKGQAARIESSLKIVIDED